MDQDWSTFVCPQLSSVKEPDKPLHFLSTHKIPVYNVSPDRTTAVPSLGQNSSSLLSNTVFVLSVCTRLVSAMLANTHIFLLSPCLVFKLL